jgi:predicted permease
MSFLDRFRNRASRALNEELRFHLEKEIELNLARGMPAEEARRQARIAFGGVEQTRERVRALDRLQFAAVLAQDFRYAGRLLRKSPGFAATAVITLALGIGANTAIFSLIRAVLLRPLPFPESQKVVQIWETKVVPHWDRRFVAAGNFAVWQERNRVFEQMSLIDINPVNLTGVGQAQNVAGAQVSGNLFSLLRISPPLGRGITLDDATGEEHVVVISDGLWREQFAASPEAVGRVIDLNDVPYRVIGVLPPEFYLPEPGPPVQVWTPLHLGPDELFDHKNHGYLAVARLKADVSLAAAQAEMNGIARGLEADSVEWNTGSGVRLLTMRQQLAGDIQPALLALMAAVGFVLLLACANVANLLLARGQARQREFAVRAALGAGRARLLRQLMTESLALALVGSGLGLWLAQFLLAGIPKLLPAALLMQVRDVSMDAWVLWFAVILSFVTTLIFGFAPAWMTTGVERRAAVEHGQRAVPGSSFELLQATEVAVAVVLLAGAGLFAKSFWRFQLVDPGFEKSGALVADTFLSEKRYPKGIQVAQFQDALLKWCEAAPGVRAAAFTNVVPLGGRGGISFSIEGHPQPPLGTYNANEQRFVTPGYFRAMGIPLLRGRYFSEQDTGDRPLVVIINQVLAKQFFPDQDPIGKRVKWSRLEDQSLPWWFTIVGVVGDTREIRLDSDVLPELYMSLPQIQTSKVPFGKFSGYLIVRTTGDPMALAAPIRDEVRKLDPQATISRFETLDQVVGRSVAQPRMIAALLILFAGVAVILTAVGVYAVVAFAVSQRTREIGIRMALGAGRKDVLVLFLRRGVMLAGAGLFAGVAGVWAVFSFIRSLLYQVSPLDPPVAVFSCMGVLLMTLAATYVPARRATRVDPMIALRHE